MWREAYIESRVTSADPVELVQMLYDHALVRIRDARNSLASGDIVGRSKAISNTIAVLSELESSLDHNCGGTISASLSELYQYMRTRLTTANLKQEDEPLGEVEGLLMTLSEAWGGVRRAVKGEPDFQAISAPGEQAGGALPAGDPERSREMHVWSA
jgi:flagellar secretion chaperone FliS